MYAPTNSEYTLPFSDLITGQTTLGRIIDWVLKYGPAKTLLDLKALQDPAKVKIQHY